MSFEWNAEIIEKLTQMWHEGLSTAEIGRRLGISKNAVVGKARRIDLPKRQTRTVAPPQPKEDNVVRLPELRVGMCSWPIGEPGTEGFRFCGKRPVVPGKPYCAEHCARAYVRTTKNKKETEAA